ncbi:MAG: DUF6600 domain-containing protein [Pyrinomonadaceae bacterium]
MRSTKLFFTAVIFMQAAFGIHAATPYATDEEPEVTDRVARFSYVSGDVSIKRAGNDDWEKAALNLPVVEGDEITAAAGARFEIQFNAYAHVRVAENSFLKITTLTDSGIALSLPEGSLSLTAKKFDTDKMFIEIDAPKTTVAVQKSGRYRIDAGEAGSSELRVSVSDDGEARVYSNNSGFSLRDGRSARIFLDGANAGEWENGKTALFTDEFDQWATDRDELNVKRLSNANYGQYYDDDIYGAEDLNSNGDWVHTLDYGYIWRPYRSTISSYSDWSPYRYGQWRWLPSYGWTWVNDEPWGWATYHHGRWIWYSGGWYWSPYSQYRQRKSWWYPALVVLRVFNNNVCWYPLPYDYGYYNYNRHYYAGRRRNDKGQRPSPSPRIQIAEPRPEEPVKGKQVRRVDIPDTGVIAVKLDDFGRGKNGISRLPQQTSRRVITEEPTVQNELPRLPTMTDIKSKVGTEIRAQTPPIAVIPNNRTIGAGKRDDAAPLDKTLQNRIIYGNRPSIQTKAATDEPNTNSDKRNLPRTGAVERPKVTTTEPTPIIQQTPSVQKKEEPTRRDTPIFVEPRRNEPPAQKKEEPTQRSTPIYVEPRRSEPPRSEPTKQRDDPPPPQRSEPRSEPTPKSDPAPQKPEPRSEPTKRDDPPPQKSDTKKPNR